MGNGRSLSQGQVRTLASSPDPVVATTLWDWGTYRDIQGLHAATDGTVYVVSDDGVQHWATDDQGVPDLQLGIDPYGYGRSVAANPQGGFVATSGGVLVHVDSAGASTPTACAPAGGRYESVAFTPSGSSVVGSSQDTVGFQHLQWCGPQGQPVDVTGTTGLRGTVLAAP